AAAAAPPLLPALLGDFRRGGRPVGVRARRPPRRPAPRPRPAAALPAPALRRQRQRPRRQGLRLPHPRLPPLPPEPAARPPRTGPVLRLHPRQPGVRQVGLPHRPDLGDAPPTAPALRPVLHRRRPA